VAKVPTYGPYVSALADILAEAETYRDETVCPLVVNKQPLKLYRNIKLAGHEVNHLEALRKRRDKK